MYTTDSIQQVRDLAAAEIIGKRLDLKRSGSKWKACCPFHGEKTASFTVTPAENMWKCFGCQRGGDAIAFIEEYDSVDFITAVETIASEHGITLVIENDGKTPEERQQIKDEKQQQYDLMEWACKLYEQLLEDNHKQILYARGVTDEDIRKWRIGYAPDAWRTLTAMLVTDGRLDMGVKLDLIKAKEETNGDVKHYDTFRNRIMLPLCDDKGNIIGFGAWACEALGHTAAEVKELKYINSGTTPLFNKSNALYGIHHAKAHIIKTKNAGITEGYFDVITAHRHGLGNIVATCGTALTDGHLKTIAKWSVEKTTLYQDKDAAGIKAKLASVDLVLKAGMVPMVAQWVDDVKDIDDLLKM